MAESEMQAMLKYEEASEEEKEEFSENLEWPNAEARS